MAMPTILYHSHSQLPYFVWIISKMCLEYGHMCPNLLNNGQGYDGHSRFYAHEGFQALISDQYFIFKLDSHNLPAVLLYFPWSRVKFKSEIICINFKLYLWAGYWLVVPVSVAVLNIFPLIGKLLICVSSSYKLIRSFLIRPARITRDNQGKN